MDMNYIGLHNDTFMHLIDQANDLIAELETCESKEDVADMIACVLYSVYERGLKDAKKGE